MAGGMQGLGSERQVQWRGEDLLNVVTLEVTRELSGVSRHYPVHSPDHSCERLAGESGNHQ